MNSEKSRGVQIEREGRHSSPTGGLLPTGGSSLDETIRQVEALVDTRSVLSTIQTLCTWHRLPGSDDLRISAEWLAGKLRGHGVKTSLFSHPADGEMLYWNYVSPPRWECQEGWLDLQHSGGWERVADFSQLPLNVIQRSGSSRGIVEAEVVVVEDWKRPGERLDGKIVLTNGSPDAARSIAIDRLGAMGVITDSMAAYPPVRPPGQLDEAVQWALFSHTRGRPNTAWGFSVSPACGKRLRAMAREGAVQVRAKVDASCGPGFLEGVEVVIPGESHEEIWLVAHLCHPAPFANDNSSGASALAECVRVIASLVGSGTVPQPRRTLRFLFPVEIAGTIAYLASRNDDAEPVLAGLNLDMVGASQALCGSVLCIDRPPDALPSCTAELLVEIYDRIGARTEGLSGNTNYPLFRWEATPFSAGSDHWVLGDPSVGIPAPMLIEWPDRHYHTTADTLEMLDEGTLRRNITAAAVYALFLAGAGEREAEWLEGASLAQSVSQMAKLIPRKGGPRAQLSYRAECCRRNLRWLGKLDGSYPSPRDSETFLTSVERVLCDAADSDGHPEESLSPVGNGPTADDASADPVTGLPRGSSILKLVNPGPISHFAYVGLLSQDEQLAFRELSESHGWAARNYYRRITHWVDGRRTLQEVADLLALDLQRRDDVYFEAYVSVLERLSLIKVEPPAAG